jgi:hypothetical protein
MVTTICLYFSRNSENVMSGRSSATPSAFAMRAPCLRPANAVREDPASTATRAVADSISDRIAGLP